MCFYFQADYHEGTREGNPVPVTKLEDYGGCIYLATPLYPYDSYSLANIHWKFQASQPENKIELQFVSWRVKQILLCFAGCIQTKKNVIEG